MSKPHEDDDIAIIGMSCRFAGADSPSKLWDILASSQDVGSDITRFNVDGYYKPDGGRKKGLTNVRRAYLMEAPIDRFDNTFFNIAPLEAEAMDPQQRILLEVSYEAVENAGVPLHQFQGSDTAVYVATIVNDYQASLLRDIDQTPTYHATGTSNAILSNRISYAFDLHGASVSIDTACSGTMVGLHLAVNALKKGESQMALVCGANVILSPDMFVHMSELGFLSPSGRCRSFDASGDGYARGDGVAAILLKPLSQALRDGDTVRAVVKGTRLNQDGRTQGLTMPSGDAQRRNLEALYSQPGLSPADIQYVEAHGTGTAVGDPIEMGAIDAVFGDSHRTNKLVVGSIKSNIGHLESTAALAGIIKTVEALERGQIPPQMHFEKPNPKIDWNRVQVPTTIMNWPPTRNGVRRAGVNSFGFGGTNGHAVLEFHPVPDSPQGVIDESPFLFKVSAASESSLVELANAYADYVERVRPGLVDLSHTLLARRSTLKKSAYLIASSHEELVTALKEQKWKTLTLSNKPIHKIAFVFTGQGAQWPQMGKQLLNISPLFRSTISACDEALSALPDGPAWSIAEELKRPKETSRLSKASFSQPICTALQIGLVELWKSWGITPHDVVGHSSGEIGAAYSAGFLSLRDAIVIAYYRGLYLGENAPVRISKQRKGAMCAVGLGEAGCAEILQKYAGRIGLAAVNSPSSCTLSGDADAIEEVVSFCAEKGTFCRALRVDMAYHSDHMLPLAPSYENAMCASGIRESNMSHSTGEMFSSVFGRRLSASDITPGYWKENMVSTVRFMDAVSELALNSNPDVFIEIGPHPALTGPVRDILASIRVSDTVHLSSCTRGKPDLVAMLENVGEMISIGIPVNWPAVNAYFSSNSQTGRVLTDVPTYQWDHSSVNWGESRVSLAIQKRQFPRHELLGARAPNDTPLAPIWRNILSTKDLHWLDDCHEGTPRALPAAIFTLMAVEAGRQLSLCEKLDVNFMSLKDLKILNPFTMPQNAVETLFMARKSDGALNWQFEIQSGPIKSNIGTWERHCVGEITFSNYSIRSPDIQRSEAKAHDEEMFRYLKSLEIVQMPPVSDFKVSADLANGRFSRKIEGYENYPVHPLLLASLLDSSELLMLQKGPPAFYSIQCLDRIDLPLGSCRIEAGSFGTLLSHHSPVSGRARLDIAGQDEFLTIDGIHLHIDGLVQKGLPLASTFFTSRTVPDITYISRSTDMSISYILQLVTHQWPMSDIGLVGLSHPDILAITSSLKGTKAQERSQFRTLDIVDSSDLMDLESNRIRILDELDLSRKYHLLVGAAKSLISDVNHLLPHGIVCVQLKDPGDQEQFDKHFTEICRINGLSDNNWVLAKAHAPQNGTIVPRKVQIFAPTNRQVEPFKEYVDFEMIPLDDPFALDQWRNSMSGRASEEKVDIIIYDVGKRSILTTWHGSDFLPWIKALLGCANSVLWVGEQIEANPYQSVASSFVKTVKAEQPSIMISSLLFQGPQEPQFVARTTYDVLNDMIHGKRDVELIVKVGLIHSVRYFPDDALSATVGIIPPVVSDVSNADEYHLSVTGKESIALVHEKSVRHGPPAHGKVRVEIESSIIDDTDIVAFSGGGLSSTQWNGLGHYFAGRVIACLDDNADLRLGTRVVGFSPDADTHQHKLDIDSKYVHALPGSLSYSEAAVRFAVYLTARVLVSAIARPTAADTFRIGTPGLLGAALEETCRVLDVTTSDRLDADFYVTFDPKQGLLLNDRAVKIIKHCEQDHLRAFAYEMLTRGSLSTTALSVFPIQDYKKAFASAKLQPFGTVLSHSAAQRLPEALIYPASRGQLFRHDGAYVLIGGLGGLGQHISRWMVHNGARHIYALSRSAAVSSEAQRLIAEMQDEGASIQVIRADATNSIVLQSALEEIRKSLPIKGCINLAMVLSDSAISTMTPEQWDSAVQVKIKSTWNLHVATMQEDDLDFFIMFSSVASIFGNRTQSNYATGNAFLNSMSSYRHSLNLPATTIALGPVVGIGVLANKEELLRSFHVSGFAASDAEELDQIMTAVVLESLSLERSVITVGFQMFEAIDGVIKSAPEQTQLYWTEYPEFSPLMDHKIGTGIANQKSLLEKLQESNSDTSAVAHEMLQDAFFACLQNLLGTQDARFDASMPLSKYGIDSLNAVAIRYWFFKEIGIDVPVFDILGSQNIEKLISRTLRKLYDVESADKTSIKKITAPERLENLTIRPLSHSQRRLWFLHNFLPDQTTYNLLLVCYIAGTVEPHLFAQAWTILMSRHEVLRSKIVDTPDGLQQIPVEGAEFPLRVIDTTADEFLAEVDRVSDLARSHVFNLEAGEVIRGWLVRSPAGTRFFLASHHLAWDRASSETVYSETTAIYKNLLAGKSPQESLQPVPYQFIDYTVWQDNYLRDKEVVNPLIGYWREKLRDIPDCVSLLPMSLTDKRPSTKLNQVGTLVRELDSELSAAIKTFCKHKGLTPFMFMASSIAALVNRLTGDEDIVINIPDGDRGHSAFDKLVGFTVNTLPIRSKFHNAMTYSKLLDEFRDSCLGAYEHRALPFDYLIQQLEVPRRTSHAAVSQITVNYQAQGSFQKVDYGTFQFVKYDHFNAKTQSDFVLEVEEQEGSGILKCSWEFDTALYNESGISDLAEMYAVFINDVITRDGDVMLEDVQLISSTDLKRLSSILQPSYELEPSLEQLNNDLFPELFTSAVSQSPNDPAVCDDTGSYTYVELNARTNAIANTLLRSGVSPGDSIAICSEQNKDFLMGIYGILRAGCSYVPIDPDFPLERIKTMLEDANVQRVLVEKVSSVQGQRILACGMKLSDMFEIDSIINLASDTDKTSPILIRPVNNLDPFCCIFTSGSTGRPKGIFLTHGQLRYQMEGYNKYIGLHRESKILLSSAIVFDMCLPAVYGAIQYGATVCVASREARYSPAKMVDFVVGHHISSCIFTSTQAQMLLNAPNKEKLVGWKEADSIVVGGEMTPAWFLREFYKILPHATLYNAYAPSETTVVNTLRRITLADSQRAGMPLEGPFFPARFHILDKKMRPVPFGVPGELYIAGPNVSKAYVNRPDVTAAAFFKDTWAPTVELEMGYGSLYRTGDLFRANRDGTVDILGRISSDRQVKIRGMRTELGEIENVIWDAYEAAKDEHNLKLSLVAVVYHRKPDSQDGTMAAYISLAEDSLEVSAEEKGQFRAYLSISLKASLPPHMLPAVFIFVDDLPRTVSGKVDYKVIALWPAPTVTSSAVTSNNSSVELTEVQTMIASVWKDILSIDSNLGPNDEFFALGGHSLMLVTLQQRLAAVSGVTIKLQDMFAYPSIAGFERLILNDTEATREDLVSDVIDWAKEASLPMGTTWSIKDYVFRPPSSVVVTGASSMIGAHFVQHILATTQCQVYCIAVDVPGDEDPVSQVIATLSRWNLFSKLPQDAMQRLKAYKGSLSHGSLGLNESQLEFLDRNTDAIYHFDSDVSMMKNYRDIRAGNVGAMQFLIKFASSPTSGRVKHLHYLSTWGVPHLQTWATTQLENQEYLKGEEELTNMTPGQESSLGYLKCRWVSEAMLYKAAGRGLPVNIYRSCMAGTNADSQQGLDRTDINRRIIESALQTGLVPDFRSEKGGGMSWIELDFLVKSIDFLSRRAPLPGQDCAHQRARIYNVVSDQHFLYSQLVDLLGFARDGTKLRSVEPSKYLQALRATGHPEMMIHAEVIQSWYEVGWTPFQLQADDTLRLLKTEANLQPPHVDREFIMKRVVGEAGF